MQNIPNPLVAVYQTQLEASRRFADAIFAGTEKIDRVMIGATQRAFNDQLDLAQAMTMVRNPQRVGSPLPSGFMARSPDDVINYQKEIVRIVAEMQNEIGRGLRAYMEQMRTQAGRTTSAVNQASPEEVRAQANDALNPVTSMFSVWEAAFKEVADLAKKNMTAARNAAEGAISHGQQDAANFANTTANSAVDAVDAAADAAGSIASPDDTEEGSADGRERKGTPSSGKKK